MYRLFLCSAALALAFVGTTLAADKSPAEPPIIDLWDGPPPGGVIKEQEKDTTKDKDHQVAGKRLIRLGYVSKPTLTVFRPAPGKENGTAVIICPGGAYQILAFDLEGTEVATWLNSLGVTAFVLKYRVPRRSGEPGDKPPLGPLQDAQRAVRLVRSMAKEYKLKSDRIGILGFSAGGHLAASTAISHDTVSYPPEKGKLASISCRPDFALLIYPAYLTNPQKTALRSELKVSRETPPMFLAHAADDPVPSENSALLYLALRKANVPAELHIYTAGGHGYGLRKTDFPVSSWPDRAADWLKARSLLTR